MSLSRRTLRKVSHRFFAWPVLRFGLAGLVLFGGAWMIHRWFFLDTAVQASGDKIITIQEDLLVFHAVSQRETIGELLRDEQIQIFPEDQVLPDLTQALHGGSTIYIRHAKPVTIVNFLGEEHVRRTQAGTVGELMQEIWFTPEGNQRVEPPIETPLSYHMTVRMFKEKEEEYIETVTVPFATKRKMDDTLAFKQEEVIQEGVTGEIKKTYRLKYQNDRLVSKDMTQETVITEKVDKIVRIGTKLPPGSQGIEQGIASFYGGRFVGQRTASGATFDTAQLTAAHLTLPFGTQVKVTNVNNGKSVIVTINDRGPYTKGRVIDLSEAAFELIGSLGSGVIPVKLETVGS